MGIDISKTQLDAANRPSGSSAQFANTDDGIAACVTALMPELIVVEATGDWERALVAALMLAQMSVSVINPRQGHDFAKTDRLDAAMFAQFTDAAPPEA